MARKSRFTAGQATVQKALAKVMRDMEVENFKVIQENDRRVIVIFVIKGTDGRLREYKYIADFFKDLLGNYRAAQLAISRIWKIYNEWHIRCEDSESSLETLLQGFRVLEKHQVLLALPDPANKKPWDVLGVSRDSTIDEVNQAFRLKAKKMHPDVGGDHDAFIDLETARDDMLEMKR